MHLYWSCRTPSHLYTCIHVYCVVVMPVPVPHNWSGIEILVFGDEDVSLVQILPAPLSEAGGCGDGERALHRGDGCICQPPRV